MAPATFLLCFFFNSTMYMSPYNKCFPTVLQKKNKKEKKEKKKKNKTGRAHGRGQQRGDCQGVGWVEMGECTGDQ